MNSGAAHIQQFVKRYHLQQQRPRLNRNPLMEELNSYITFRYQNWLDYANHMSRIHKFDGWGPDLLNECLIELLKKDRELLLGLLARKTKKIVNGKPTTELDKFVLKMMHLNAFSPVAPFRKHTLGHKIINRQHKKVKTAKHAELNGHDIVDEIYTPELNDRLDTMHTRNMIRLKNNGFGPGAMKLYTDHFIEGQPFKLYTETEQDFITEINSFLLTRKTLLDD